MMADLIPIGVHIGSKGCAIRYLMPRGNRHTLTPERSCECPPGCCWVTYARDAHKRGESAMGLKEWVKAGAPMPPSRLRPPPKPKCQAEVRRGGTRGRCFHNAREGQPTCGTHKHTQPHDFLPGTPGFVPPR